MRDIASVRMIDIAPVSDNLLVIYELTGDAIVPVLFGNDDEISSPE